MLKHISLQRLHQLELCKPVEIDWQSQWRLICRDVGVGLAAPQVGVNVRLMLYNPEGEQGKGKEYILVNPRIVKTGKGTDTMEEGCLSFIDHSIDLDIRADVTVSSLMFLLALLHCQPEHVCTPDKDVRVSISHVLSCYSSILPVTNSVGSTSKLCQSQCVCIPDNMAWFVLQRPLSVKIKAQDETGAKVSLSLTDFQARIFQHEYDHLQASFL